MLTRLPHPSEPEISPETFESIGRILKGQCGFTLEGYKDKCVKRRINIRIRATRCASPEEYRELLTRDASELPHLLRVLTIHVSHFFRNPATFEKIGREVLPCLLGRAAGREVRLLSVGCAGGEEPYSLAILLSEQFPEELAAGRFRIVGTDVDAAALEGAQQALFHPDRLGELTPQRLERWFTPENGRFRLNPEIRELVQFERADLNHFASSEERDLILCRNVLIYFERPHQEAILNGFADALGSGGFLVLGKSETLFGSARRRFRTVCPVERIYQAT